MEFSVTQSPIRATQLRSSLNPNGDLTLGRKLAVFVDTATPGSAAVAASAERSVLNRVATAGYLTWGGVQFHNAASNQEDWMIPASLLLPGSTIVEEYSGVIYASGAGTHPYYVGVMAPQIGHNFTTIGVGAFTGTHNLQTHWTLRVTHDVALSSAGTSVISTSVLLNWSENATTSATFSYSSLGASVNLETDVLHTGASIYLSNANDTFYCYRATMQLL